MRLVAALALGGLAIASEAIAGFEPYVCRSGLPIQSTPVPVLAEVIGKPGTRSWFFRDTPACPSGTECKRQAYVVPGDRLIVRDRTGDWACAWFVSQGGVVTNGYLRASGLQDVPTPPDDGEGWRGSWVQSRPTALENDLVGELEFIERDGAWLVSGIAFWSREREDGEIVVNFGEIEDQPLVVEGDLARFEAEVEYDCAASFRRLGDYLIVEDNGHCGGHNVTFGGVYLRAPTAKENKR
jgi:hypothetical protein